MLFTAKDVQALRAKTGVGMMDCKNALTEAGGDMEKATSILREKGLAAAEKKSGRIAAEGMVYATADKDKEIGVVIEVNSETDFVAKNKDFQAFVKAVAKIVADENPADVDALLKLKYDDAMTVQESLNDKVLVIGENINIRRFVRYQGNCVAYVHGDGRIGVIVRFDADDVATDSDELQECGRDVAMQIAALNPLFLDSEAVPAETVKEEKDVIKAQIKNDESHANKPENIIERIVEGRMGRFYKENCLLEQEFVKDLEVTVAQYIKDMAEQAGGEMKVVEFVRFEKGEGLERREDDFAQEIADMMK